MKCPQTVPPSQITGNSCYTGTHSTRLASSEICITYLHESSTAAGKVRRPAAQSKLRELRQRARATCFVPLSTSRKKGLFLEVMCEMMSASRKRGLFLEVKPVNVTGLRSPGHSVQKMQNNRNFTLSRFYVEPLS